MADYENKKVALFSLFKKKFVIKKIFKNKLADLNLRRLRYISLILLIFGIVMLVLYTANTSTLDDIKLAYIIYYISFLLIYSLVFLLCHLFKNKTNINPAIRNIPLYISILSMNALCLYNIFFGTSTFDSFIIFASESVIISIFFYVEPLFFDTVMIITFLIMSPKIVSEYDYTTLANLSFFVIIINVLSLYKWNSTIKEMEHQKEQEDYTKTLEMEINLASYVQKSFYKHGNLVLDGWTITAYSEPMAGVSGDMHDIYYTKNHLDGLGIFDVSGHGIASGLVTMLVKNIIHQEFYNGLDDNLHDVLQNINDRVIEEKGEIENYLTGTLIRINENKVEFINAGNPQPLIFMKDENNSFFYENKDSSQYGVIGMADFPVNYSTNTIEMKSGDEILFYTDGIIENTNNEGYPYGKTNLMKTFSMNTFKTCEDQMKDIISHYLTFKGNQHSTDDITLLILKKL